MSTMTAKKSAAASHDAQQDGPRPAQRSAEMQHVQSIPDAMRRFRWLAADLDAAGFGLYLAAHATDRPKLEPCFDSAYPDVADFSEIISSAFGEDMCRHIGHSTVPRWWSNDPSPMLGDRLAGLRWAIRCEPLVPHSSGIAFPVYGERGRCGLAVFLGPDLSRTSEMLCEIHACCFALFAAVVRIQPRENGPIPSISKRELECLRLTSNGYTSEDIARVLKLSVHTANQYLTNTTQKLNAVNRMHAVAKALRLGLLD